MRPKIILTCEHGGIHVPKGSSALFNKKELQSHKSFDFGAADICEVLKKKCGFDVHINYLSRLLIDMNRSLKTQKHITPQLKTAYLNYREGIWSSVKDSLRSRQDFYIFSIHSFVPVMNGKVRKTDIGLLYRTNIVKEASIAKSLRKHFESSARLNQYKTHFNLPYRGHTDCLLNDLLDQFGGRRQFKGGCFLEFNQNLLKKNASSVKLELADFLSHLD